MKIQDNENPLSTKINDLIENCIYADIIKIDFEVISNNPNGQAWFKDYDLLLAFVKIDHSKIIALVPYEFTEFVNAYLSKVDENIIENLFQSHLDYDFYKEKYILCK